MMPKLPHRLRAWPLLALLLGAPAVQAVLITSWQVDAAIPDANSSGLVSVQSVVADFDRIGRLSVTLEINHGWMGDLYAYLLHDTGFSVLLNRPGRSAANPFGSAAGGLTLTFDDRAAVDAHTTPAGTAKLTGLRQPDAREIDPAHVLDTSARTAYLSNFNGLDPNGQWTLFIADLAAGDRATLVRWGLEIEPERTNPVPEGVMTLPILAASLAGLTIARRRGRLDRRRQNKTRPTP
jgi:subtilisin-like proprotein convertase family protein